jgi:DNA-binding transcriptional LysR family regulator
MRVINQRQIEAFRAVMIAGGVTAAAGHLHVTQPAVSRLIRDLEGQIGVAMFERRSGGRLRPTSDALTLFREVERYFVGLDQIAQTAAELRRRSIGRLRVASLPALYVGLLPRFVGRFLAARPVLDLELYGISSDTVIDWVTSGRCDIGFVDPPFEHPSIIRRPLAAVPALAAIPASHPLAQQAVLKPSDFADETFISISKSTQLRVRVDSFFLASGVKRRLGQETPLSIVACSLVAAGAGLAIVDPFTAKAFSDLDVVFRPLEPRIDVQFSIITAAQSPLSGPSRDFIAGADAEIESFARTLTWH